VKISSDATMAKSFTIKREKSDDNIRTIARLKFSDLFISREQINEIACQRPGWAETSLFDEQGAPLGKWRLLLDSALSATGSMGDPANSFSFLLPDASLSKLEMELTKLGAVLSGCLSWPISGDEVGDIEPLLGRKCAANWVLSDGGQIDLLKD